MTDLLVLPKLVREFAQGQNLASYLYQTNQEAHPLKTLNCIIERVTDISKGKRTNLEGLQNSEVNRMWLGSGAVCGASPKPEKETRGHTSLPAINMLHRHNRV